MHRDGARQTFDRPRDLAHGPQAIVGQRHGIDDSDPAAIRLEDRFEDVGARQILARGIERDRRLQHERAAALGVEVRGKDRRRIEVGQAEPVDRAVLCHERCRAAVADDRVIANFSVSVDAHFESNP